MKTLKQYINEALKIGKDLSEWSTYTCQPKTKSELEQIIKDRIDKELKSIIGNKFATIYYIA